MGCGASTASKSSHVAPLLPHTSSARDDTAAGGVIQVRTADSSASGSTHGSDNATDHSSAQQHAAAAAAAAASSVDPRASSNSLGAPQPGHRHTLSHTEDRFVILKVLGEGASCKVVSVRDRLRGAHYAMKIMDKSEPYNGVLFENEALILRTLQHPNILQYVESYEDKSTYHLLTVLCQGGELFDRVKNGSFSEQSAAQLARQMLHALAYCHSHSIVHRDLKVGACATAPHAPRRHVCSRSLAYGLRSRVLVLWYQPENFVFASPAEDSCMQLIDFGCAKLVDDAEVIADVAGSPYYCAPEILSDTAVRTGAVWKAADMWSVGVILFLLVCGFPPFNGDSQEKIFRKIKKGKFRFPRPSELGGVELSDSVQHLITQLLQMQPGKRLSAEAALNHPWVSGVTASSTPLPSVVIDALSSFRAQCRLKKAAARVLLNRMTEDDRLNLKAVFSRFDVNGDGQLGPEEVTRLMRSIGKESEEARLVLSTLDDDGDGGVSFSEFEQAAALGKLNTEAEIKRSFDMFDLDHDGFITHAEIERVCGLNKDTVAGMVREVDKDGQSSTHTFTCTHTPRRRGSSSAHSWS